MKAQSSVLKILDFRVADVTVKQIDPVKPDSSFSFEDYEIEIDFDVMELASKEDLSYIIPMQIKVNNIEEPLVGYSISVDAFGQFDIDTAQKMSKTDIHNLKIYSSVNIMISNLRGYLRDITSYHSFGTFHLPSIDMNALLKAKDEEVRGLKKIKKQTKKGKHKMI